MRRTNKAIEVFLQPGEYFVGDADYRIRTLLGSCVSITLWHPGRRIGAMSHFMLSARGTKVPGKLDGRYGEDVMTLMLRELAQAKVPITECQAKIFGGGNMFPRQKHLNFSNVGQKNGETARQLLLSMNIPIVSESLFGIGYRQVMFDVASGHVWSRQVNPPDAA